MLTAYEIIRKKRDGGSLSPGEIELVVREYTSGKIPEYQISSFFMSVFFRGMSDEETLSLTQSMMQTGIVVDLSDIPGCKADKHSTGGVGDKISLMLGPLAAACGARVPMISGRGLGHTGGTVDKLESIHGFRTRLSIEEYKRILREVGIVMSAQSDDLVPADRKMYALRDVTATVESIPLITASIMSKKLAEGIDSLVLDVKVGNGAFMKSLDEARELANKMVRVGRSYGKKVTAYLTDMNQPLGREIGNWNEVVESVKVLRGESDAGDLVHLSTVLTAEMISLCSGEALSTAEAMVRKAIESGAGYEKFLDMVRAQNGDVAAIKNPSQYRSAKVSLDVKSNESGFVTSMDTFKIGMASVKLGAGRLKLHDKIDPTAGISLLKKIGDNVSAGEEIAIIHASDRDRAADAAKDILSSYNLGTDRPSAPQLVRERIAS